MKFLKLPNTARYLLPLLNKRLPWHVKGIAVDGKTGEPVGFATAAHENAQRHRRDNFLVTATG
jgi:hypothetical protein